MGNHAEKTAMEISSQIHRGHGRNFVHVQSPSMSKDGKDRNISNGKVEACQGPMNKTMSLRRTSNIQGEFKIRGILV
jgi:hypothetical protein